MSLLVVEGCFAEAAFGVEICLGLHQTYNSHAPFLPLEVIPLLPSNPYLPSLLFGPQEAR